MNDERPFGIGGPVIPDGNGDGGDEPERAEAMAAPPASVLVPRIRGRDVVEPEVVGYPLIGFPWEPWTLTSYLTLTPAQATAWADWLSHAEARRLAVIATVLAQAGAPVGAARERPDELLTLGAWVQQWFGLVAEPFLARGVRGDPGWRPGFFQDQPEVRLGSAWAPHGPWLAGYSRSADTLLHSLAVDLAFLITDCARAARPGLRWRAACDEQFRDYFVTPDPEPPPFELLRQVREFLVQSLARPRGSRGRELRHWRSRALFGCYQRAAEGAAQRPEYEAFPGSNEYREGARYQLARPERGDPPPPADLVAAVAAFRQAGWFETSKLTATDLAAAALATWRAFEGEDIPPVAVEMNWRLLVLDNGRTWSEDVDADVRPQDNLHEQTLFAIGQVGGKGFGKFSDAEEDWASTPGDVGLSFRWRRRQHRLQLPAPGRYLSPALITGLNDLLPPDQQRLWFCDHGPPIAVVTRATAAERDALRQLTGIRLDPDPPAWWTRLAPLPPPPGPRPARRTAATRPGRPRTPRGNGTAGSSSSRSGLGPGRAATPAPAGAPAARQSAQDVFRQMMRDLVTPALRELGFRGSWSRALWYQDGDYAGTVWTQKSVHSSKDWVNFTVHLSAAHVLTNAVYWTSSLLGLIPGNEDSWWTVSAGVPADTVAARVLGAFRSYGWPAILAALDEPGFPPDPAVRWARTFPPAPSSADRQHTRADHRPPAWVLQPASRDSDSLFAELADEDYITRYTAVELISDTAIDDPRAVPALLDRLERDPSQPVRLMAARGIRPLARHAAVRQALQQAAASDEDVEIRWEARYAIRLTKPAGPEPA